jgi:hypothetical protein
MCFNPLLMSVTKILLMPLFVFCRLCVIWIHWHPISDHSSNDTSSAYEFPTSHSNLHNIHEFPYETLQEHNRPHLHSRKVAIPLVFLLALVANPTSNLRVHPTPKIFPTQNCAIVSTNARTHARIAQPKKTRHTQVKNDKQPLQQEKQRECRNPLLPVFISPVPRKSGMLVSNLASTKRPNVARRSLPTSKKRQTTRFICTTFRTRARRYTRCF